MHKTIIGFARDAAANRGAPYQVKFAPLIEAIAKAPGRMAARKWW